MIDPAPVTRVHRVVRPAGLPRRCADIVAVPHWSIVVPAKRLAVAKTRLRPLTAGRPDAHSALVLALLADTVAAALGCPAVADVVVVTDDEAATAVVRALGARTVPDEPDRGLNPALEHGARSARTTAVAALSSDLPALRPAELGRALATAERAPRCFVADAQGTGTTLLTARGVPLRPRFGAGSALAHRADGARPLTGDWPGLVRDVDTEADLRAALALGVGASTAAALDSALTGPPGAAP
jgi:2-phospho-L-lactate guanylyltransferase